MFLFVQWQEYFHAVKDGMFYSTRLSLRSIEHSIFHLAHENILTIVVINIHYLYNNARCFFVLPPVCWRLM